jgi:hypothetical protein
VLFALVALVIIISVNDAFAQSTPEIILNKPDYTWTDKVLITIKSSTLSGTGSIFVSVSTKDHSLDNYKLSEESPGVFIGKVTLTGFEYDAYGDGKVATTPKTSGTGSKNGFLQSERDDMLTIVFDYNNSKITKNAIITWHLGKFLSDVSECIPDTTLDCIAIVEDPDMNLYPNRLDHLYEVLIFSDSDPVGIDVVMVETGDETGKFSWHYSTSTYGPSHGNTLHVSPGDNITIKYVDHTPPKQYPVSRPIDVIQNYAPAIIPDIDGGFDDFKSAKIQKNDATIIFPENLDIYFSSIKGIHDRLKTNNVIPANQYHLEKSADEKNDEIIITEKLIIDTKNYNEFLAVFQLDPASQNIPFSVGNTIVDNNYLDQKINSYLISCSQNNKPDYCSLTPGQIKNLILQKIGTHTITESITLKKILTLSKDNSFGDKNKVSKLIPTTFSENNEDIPKVIYSISGSLYEIEQIPSLPSAFAQLESSKTLFLNGFTIGYGFEKSWFYEFTVLDMIPISLDAHIENGLGIGLRIPIEVILGIESTEPQMFDVIYTINTKNLSNEDYENLLGFGKGFGGKEFKMYLGPKISLKILVLGDSVYDYSKQVFETPEESDFRPPLDKKQTSLEISSYTVPCDKLKTCFELPIGTVGLSMGSRVDMSGEKITLTSSPINSLHPSHTAEFFYNGHSASFPYDIIDTSKSYGTTIKDLKYYSDLHFVPRVMIDADMVLSWLLPFDLSTGWIDFPEILFEDIVFEKHEGALDKFSNTPDPKNSGILCGDGYEMVNGICQVIKEDKKPGGACLIATAAFGSELAPQVQQLRELRDSKLLQTESGSSFMNIFNHFYYSFSSTIADWERENPVFREMVKIMITPMISSLSILNYVDMDSEESILGYGIGLIILNIGMYFVVPAIVIVGIKKKIEMKLKL